MAKKWIIPVPALGRVEAARRWRVPPLVAELLINRGLSPEEPADSFLSPQLKNLHPPNLLSGATAAAAKIVDAVRGKSKIVLYGDYDVDGITGIAILWHALVCAGASVDFYVPHRVEEGYGLNLDAIRRLTGDGAELIVSIDCGISAVEVARELADSNVPLVITDHHTPQATLPRAEVIVHPRLGDEYPNPDLCGAGVAFKLAWAIAQQLSDSQRVSPEFRELLTSLLPLAAMGTIADVVSLTGENRIIAKHGLSELSRTSLPGLRALIDSAGIRSGRVDDYDVGFRLAPRLNAAGRMGHARLAVELLTRADAERAREIALYLEEHNRSRRAVERKIFKQACEVVERNRLATDARRAIVLASEGWHAGVIGIVAARLVDRYHRPVVMIAVTGDEGQGSARSIDGFNLAAALESCGEHLVSHGGHAMAAGLRIAGDRIDSFTEAFVGIANNWLCGDDLLEKLRLDAEVPLDALTLPTAEAIRGLGPFGAGNPRPRFASDWLELAGEPRCVGSGSHHLQASFRQYGASIRAIGFGLGGRIEDLKQHRRCRVAFEPIINEFKGRRTVELQMIDLQFPA